MLFRSPAEADLERSIDDDGEAPVGLALLEEDLSGTEFVEVERGEGLGAMFGGEPLQESGALDALRVDHGRTERVAENRASSQRMTRSFSSLPISISCRREASTTDTR